MPNTNSDSTHIDPAEKELTSACKMIGDIGDCSHWYTAKLAERIKRHGKPVMQLTLQELIKLDGDEIDGKQTEACSR